MSAESAGSVDLDPLQTADAANRYWTTTNTEEAHPGVLTPLGWTVAGPGIEAATRGSLHAIGVLTAKEAAVPERAEDRAFAVFCGRFAARLDFFVDIGNRLPGTSGPAMVEHIFNFVPPDASAAPIRRRYGGIAWRLPMAFAQAPRRARALRADTAAWWPGEIDRVRSLDLRAAREQFAAANDRFNAVALLDGIALLAAIQPIYEQLVRLAERVEVPSGPLLTGHGSHEEARVVADLWARSRGELGRDSLIARHGFHGPRTGELSSRSWREDPAPLDAAVERYRSMPDDADPREAEARRAADLARAETEVLRRLPVHRRAPARFLFRLARSYLPLRGKAGRTQALDVMRAASRQIGHLLARDGALDDPEDVFMLTVTEVAGDTTADLRAAVVARRQCYEKYVLQELPRVWQGNPVPILIAPPGSDQVEALSGVAASSGVVVGPARVITDPDAQEIEPGEILVAHTTDPSWASIMFLASGLVVDVGGLLSHGAVVARELGVPCVMDTKSGTTAIRTGDVCRVDGDTGEVRIVERA